MLGQNPKGFPFHGRLLQLAPDNARVWGHVNDKLTIDFSGGTPQVPVAFHGGAGGYDVLALEGGNFTNEIYEATGPDAGTISLDAFQVSWLGTGN